MREGVRRSLGYRPTPGVRGVSRTAPVACRVQQPARPGPKMFSFASKMLNTLIGEGESQPQDPQGLGQQPQPMFRPPSARPPGVGFRGPSGPLGPPGPQLFPSPALRPQGPRTDLRPRLGLARPQAGPSHMMQRPPPPIAPGRPNLNLSTYT